MELEGLSPPHRKRSTNTQPKQIQLWILRILGAIGTERYAPTSRGVRLPDSVIRALGLQRWEEDENFDAGKFRKYLATQLAKLEKDPEALHPPTPLHKNCQRLRDIVGLTAADAAILELAVSVHAVRSLDDASDLMEQMNHSGLTQALAEILNLPLEHVIVALSAQGLLAKSGLVKVDHNTVLLRGKLDLIGAKFANSLAGTESDLITLLRGIVNRSAPAQLSMNDFGHATKSTDIILPYLRRAKCESRPGVNILLFGPPGTGKTELVKAMAHQLGLELFEVAYEDDDGDPVNAEYRLRAYRVAQCFFGKQQSMLLFDEIEDVFNDCDGLFAGPSTAQKRKAWINRSLETNSIPTVWVSNSIARMDRAILRRFDIVMELPVPPFQKRLQISTEACADLLPSGAIERIARSEILSPAVVARATSVIRLIKDDLGVAHCAEAVERLIDGTLEAQCHQPLRRQNATQSPDIYDPAFISVDTDLASVAQGLKSTKSGRLCLYGPPGTGKTAFGRWLAQEMDVPLLVKRGSDLLGKYVGENEQNVAHAFAQAARDGAILLIDEVDSFLRDRRDAQRSWESSLVNEMLTQMEAFDGIFIASTNLMDNLDQASLRRFDLKVKFGYLHPDQAASLFLRYCQAMDIVTTDEQDLQRLRQIGQLTPGDFAAVRRRARFHPIKSAAEFVTALQGECSVKEPQSRRIGFVQ
jgi:transitional endoplasmic reticulum ATPase